MAWDGLPGSPDLLSLGPSLPIFACSVAHTLLFRYCDTALENKHTAGNQGVRCAITPKPRDYMQRVCVLNITY